MSTSPRQTPECWVAKCLPGLHAPELGACCMVTTMKLLPECHAIELSNT